MDTIGSYGHEHTPDTDRLFSLIEALSEKVLEEKYQPPKSRKKKPLDELLQEKEVKKTATPLRTPAHVQFFGNDGSTKQAAHLHGGKKVIVEKVRLKYQTVELKPPPYFPKAKRRCPLPPSSFSTGNDRWLVRERPRCSIDRCAWMVVRERGTVPTAGTERLLGKAFMQKDEIIVPNRMLRTYFQKFILKAVEKTAIEPEGFEVTSTRKLEYCRLALTKHPFKNKWLVVLKFQYMGGLFQYGDRQDVRTALHFDSETRNTG